MKTAVFPFLVFSFFFGGGVTACGSSQASDQTGLLTHYAISSPGSQAFRLDSTPWVWTTQSP